MTRPLVGLLLVVLSSSGCNQGPTGPVAKFWTARDYLSKNGTGVDFGGWRPSQLLTMEGQPLTFIEGTQAKGHGLTVFPGVSDGQSVPFVITDVWSNHPQPWVQPVWNPPSASAGGFNIFPVGVDSTFYSPWWLLDVVATKQVEADVYRSARDILNAEATHTPGPLILCPFMPDAVGLANASVGPVDPSSRTPLANVGLNPGWVEGTKVSYMVFGTDLTPFENQSLSAFNAYFFVTVASDPANGGADKPLPVSAVLPSDPYHHGWVQRVDVLVPTGAEPYVPQSRPELRALISAHFPDLTVPAQDEPAFVLRLATNPACFTATDFPAGCDWLDSVARIEQLPVASRIERPVQLTLGMLHNLDGGVSIP